MAPRVQGIHGEHRELLVTVVAHRPVGGRHNRSTVDYSEGHDKGLDQGPGVVQEEGLPCPVQGSEMTSWS